MGKTAVCGRFGRAWQKADLCILLGAMVSIAAGTTRLPMACGSPFLVGAEDRTLSGTIESHRELGEPAPPTLPSVFRNDARLQTKITLAVKDRPLREVLTDLGAQVRLSLTASPETADDKVTLFLDDRPAGEALALLARHFDFRWYRLFRGYELRQEAAESQREAALRQADLDADWAEIQEWVGRVAHWVDTPRAQAGARAQEIARLLADARLAPEERSRLTAEAAAIRDALRSETPPAIRLLQGLKPAQVAQLRRDECLLLSREDGSLPSGVPKLTRKEETSKDSPTEDVRTHPTPVDASVRMGKGWYSGGPPRPVERRFGLGVEFVVRLEGEGKRRWDYTTWSPLLPTKERAAALPGKTDDPVLLRPIDLSTVEGSHRSGPGAGRGPSAPAAPPGRWPAWPTLGDVARALHQAAGLEVLADSFVRYRVDPKLLAGRQPVVRFLDTLARELDCTWQKEGNLLLLRSRAYHWDRAVEVPESVLGPWRERAARPGTRALDALAELAAALDDLQTLGMCQCWGWYLDDPSLGGGPTYELHAHRRHLRFWAALSPAQRRDALSGAILPAERMSPNQRRAFVTALTDPVADPGESGAAFLLSHRTLTPADVLAGGFRLQSVEWRAQRFNGTRPNGESLQITALHPAYRPPVLSNLPEGFQWVAMGDPTRVDRYTFAYHLTGEANPARTVELAVVQPRAPS